MATANGSKLLARTVLGVAAAAALAVTGCSAGQVTQTDTQVAPVPGNTATVGEVSLQDLMIAFNGVEGYTAGDNAPLIVRVFNNATDEGDRLISVSSPDADAVTIAGGETDEPPAAESPSPDGESPAPGTSPSPGDQSPEPTPAGPQGGEIDVAVSASGFVMLVPGEGMYLQLEGINEDLRPGSIVEVTFTFERAGTVTVDIPMGTPLEPQDRETAETDDAEH